MKDIVENSTKETHTERKREGKLRKAAFGSDVRDLKRHVLKRKNSTSKSMFSLYRPGLIWSCKMFSMRIIKQFLLSLPVATFISTWLVMLRSEQGRQNQAAQEDRTSGSDKG